MKRWARAKEHLVTPQIKINRKMRLRYEFCAPCLRAVVLGAPIVLNRACHFQLHPYRQLFLASVWNPSDNKTTLPRITDGLHVRRQ